MIIKIQEELQSVFMQQDNIPKNIIYLEEMEEVEFNTSPWISILPDKASIEEAWHWDNAYNTEDNFVKVKRKYNIHQPIIIRMLFEDKIELDNILNTFLRELSKEFIIDNSVVSIIPQDIEYIFSKGELGANIVIITINTIYPIHDIIVNNEKIKNINFNMKNK